MKALQQQAIIGLLLVLSCFAHDQDQPRELENPRVQVVTTASDPNNLGLCEGDCDRDSHCQEGLYCFQRNNFQAVPGCNGGESDPSRTDYCVYKQPPEPTQSPVSTPTETPSPLKTGKLTSYGASPPASKFPLGICEGDCDNDSHCETGLICFQRGRYEPVPGCIGTDVSKTDYCIDPNAVHTPVNEDDPIVTEYTPGKLTVRKIGLLLSEGLDARLVAISGQHVQNLDGSESSTPFHWRPDGAATFPDEREGNEGGWIYLSNSEMEETGQGGVGAITFDSAGNVLEYKMVLQGTTMNCGGGRTPWMTWVTCEEVNGRLGHVYQVDPTGERVAEKMVLGNEGGRWESFAYDVRNSQKPHFYVTEDHHEGALSRFTPTSPDWENQWEMLHGEGTIDYLQLDFDNSSNGGTFEWISDKEAARQNARDHYPKTEGIDIHDSELFFVCKGLRKIYTLNLDNNTWYRTSTVSGLFDGQPDQLQRILQNPIDLLYFTEEGGVDAGIHARDEHARFYTIMESPVYPGETTGLSLSPDGRFMYVAYQDVGKLFCLWRRDGQPFGAEHLDVKFHEAQQG
jgi:hypothetical protein